MNRYVRLKGNNSWLLFVDKNTTWTPDQIQSENKKAVEIAKMAFLDHGEPLLPLDHFDDILNAQAAYLNPPASPLLVYEGGCYFPFTEKSEIVEEVFCEFYPILPGSAIICENDPFDKYRGRNDYHLLGMAKFGGAESFHIMSSFRCRTEREIVNAFKDAPVIAFDSSYKEADWWELMLRCIIISKTKARIIGGCPKIDNDRLKRFRLCVEFAAKYGIVVEPYVS